MGLIAIRKPAENYLVKIAEFLNSLDSLATSAQIPQAWGIDALDGTQCEEDDYA
jgi:hypothetical protein